MTDTTAYVTRTDTTVKTSTSVLLDQVRQLSSEQRARPRVVIESSGGLGDYGLPVIFFLGLVVLMLFYFRSRRKSKSMDRDRPGLRAVRDRQDDDKALLDSTWRVRDLDTGGRFHLSLANGLEEDFDVVRRDRIDRPDGRIEYNLVVTGPDAAYPFRMHWWVIGSTMNCWLFENEGVGLSDLGLEMTSLDAMISAGSGEVQYGDESLSLETCGTYHRYEAGKRPDIEYRRWLFRSEPGTRIMVIQETPTDGVEVLFGEEMWLRDMTIITPKHDEPDSTPSQ